MIRISLLSVAVLVGVVGCGKIDQPSSDSSVVVEPTVPAYNCKYDTPTNSYGCYSSSVVFHNETVVKGLWSVYTQSNSNRTDGVVFYDRYLYGFDFFEDGSAGKQLQTDGYTYYREWGVNDEGSSITVSTDGTYAYKATFSSDQQCFEVANGGDTLKFCHESYENSGANLSPTGLYYGAAVRFGNRTDYNFLVPGNWSISGYGDNNAPEVALQLDENGTVASGGEWGVSGDGKLMEIDGVRYLVYQYLEPLSDQCIAVFELYGGGAVASDKWKLCKKK
jgi:hypothetical protein